MMTNNCKFIDEQIAFYIIKAKMPIIKYYLEKFRQVSKWLKLYKIMYNVQNVSYLK